MTDIDLQVLRAVARLSRMRKAVDCETLALRAGGSPGEVRASLGRLACASLIDSSRGARLTMAGLAVAVASGAAVVNKRANRRVNKPRTHAANRRAA